MLYPRMQPLVAAAAALLIGICAPASAADRKDKEHKEVCESENALSAICGVVDAEDLAVLPGTRIVIASSVATPSRIISIDSRSHTTNVLIGQSVRLLQDRSRFPTCPGPLNAEKFQAHGMSLVRNGRGSTSLYVVNHGGREAIEIFDVRKGKGLSAVWVGCVPLPDGAMGNGVVAFPDGALAATNFGTPTSDLMGRVFRGELTGGIIEWDRHDGWHEVPGGRLSGANGIDASEDGHLLVSAASGDRKVRLIDRSGKAAPVDIALDFVPDNVRRSSDGRFVIAGYTSDQATIAACLPKTGCFLDYKVVALDVKTRRIQSLFKGAASATFGNVAVGLLMGRKLWLGPFRGDRIAIADVTN